MTAPDARRDTPPAGIDRLVRARSEPLDPDAVAEAVLDATSMLGAIGTVIMLVDPTGAITSVAMAGASRGIATSLGPLALSKRYPLMTAVLEGRPLWLASRAAVQARFPEFAATMFRGQAIADLPLMHDDTLIGAVGIPFGDARSFSDVDRAYLLTVAELAAAALTVAPGDPTAGHPDAALLARLHDAVVVLDRSTGTITFANEAARDLAGLAPEELIGAAVGQVRDRLVPADDPFRAVDLAELGWGVRRIRLVRPDGEGRVVELHVSEADERGRQAIVAIDTTHRSTEGTDADDRSDRIDRELHDRAVQAVFAASMGLAALAQVVRAELRPQVDSLLADLDEVVEQLRAAGEQ